MSRGEQDVFFGWKQQVQDVRRQHAMKVRAGVEKQIRFFFEGRSFQETPTPLFVPSPGSEPHLHPFKLEGRSVYLPTSPEFSMKRLLVGGLPRIFQITRAFRDEPVSSQHLPEFSLLEWYRTFSSLEDLMQETEELLQHLATFFHASQEWIFQGQSVSVRGPWPRWSTRFLFQRELGIDLCEPGVLEKACRQRSLGGTSWDDCFFLLWLNEIEPRLPRDRAFFVTDYPPSQAALAEVQRDAEGQPWARRFEVYLGGLELGNAFEELRDPLEQRRRFEADRRLRLETYGTQFPTPPLDEGFLQALEEGLPPTSGIAMGLDRLVMLLANESDIRKTVWLPPFLPPS